VNEDAEEPDVVSLRRRVDELLAALVGLRHDFEQFRESVGRGVATSRLAIVTDDGFERIVLTSGAQHGSVAVRARSVLTAAVVEVFANDVDGRAHVGVALSEGGDVVSVLDLFEGEGARLWVVPDDDVGPPSR
jgi:hypothetical protein